MPHVQIIFINRQHIIITKIEGEAETKMYNVSMCEFRKACLNQLPGSALLLTRNKLDCFQSVESYSINGFRLSCLYLTLHCDVQWCSIVAVETRVQT